jgi:hypothetical protein
VNQRFVDDLHVAISAERLESYRPNDQSSDLEMVSTYLWNIALSEALYPSLQVLEIALRNSIHAALAKRYGTEEWFDSSDYLEFRQQHAILDAKIAITSVGKDVAITAGRVIAQLNFGFWTTIMSRKYFTTFWEPDNFALLDSVFPHVPRGARNRKTIYDRCDQIRKLRNRVFHFEPVWNRLDLQRDYDEILETIGWISTSTAKALAVCDRFHDVYHDGYLRIEQMVDNLSD